MDYAEDAASGPPDEMVDLVARAVVRATDMLEERRRKPKPVGALLWEIHDHTGALHGEVRAFDEDGARAGFRRQGLPDAWDVRPAA